ncbi:hypothetical protein V5G98_18085 [Vibrio cholerae]|nr:MULTISPECIES: hypothetical protein [Vibrio]WOQ88743.1 hypothetical protein R4536_15590 [Vibrio cholerae]WOQ92322.1 hypothetical protein R4535_16125 [Vibrio cholerae]WOQ99477.1 hypothetical protein R4537_02765 [Vibrio paracholerae]
MNHRCDLAFFVADS